MRGLIVAGGESRRMGRNKATIARPDGTLQIDHLIQLLGNLCDEILISTNDTSIAPAKMETIPDLNPGNGPLGALASYEARHPGAPVLLLGCDYFLMDAGTLEKLVCERDEKALATAYLNRIDGRAEPLCTIYEPEGIRRAVTALHQGEKCARGFLEKLQPHLVELENRAALDNQNTPEALDEAFTKITDGVSEKSVRVLYFAKLREARGLSEETVTTLANTTAGLYDELGFRHRFPLMLDSLRCARNGDFCGWGDRIQDGDEIVFIPPVAGG